jgi:amino acid adenylation domain-containing protein
MAVSDSSVATLHEYFLTAALARPEGLAVVQDGVCFTYGEVRSIATNVARFLSGRGLFDSGRTVGVLCQRGASAYAAMLGVLMQGCVYMPLDPSSPVERLARVVRQGGAEVLIAEPPTWPSAAALRKLSDGLACLVLGAESHLDIDDVTCGIGWSSVGPKHCSDTSPNDSPPISRRRDSVAYLLFTSGSTGTPKGVPVTHDNACTCIEALTALYPFAESDRITQCSHLCFDVSILEICGAWKAGAALCVPSFADLMAPRTFVRRCGATVWSSVPTLAHHMGLLGLLTDDSMPSLRLTLFCGEALPTALAARWQKAAPRSLIVNLYGPTEATICATSYVYSGSTPLAMLTVPLGRPLAGFDYTIAPAERGDSSDPGELLLSGPQVVSGYWADGRATSASFVTFPDDPNRRCWYRTGDLVSIDAIHGLLFHGRLDHQVKVRGHRVELLEVENAVRDVIRAQIVVVVPLLAVDGRCEDLVAYCDQLTVTERDARMRCREVLPGYMVPSRYIELHEFPKTANGKLDRLTLTGFANQQRTQSPSATISDLQPGQS